ncbi:DUF2613 domain-containing protein [Corynebacterium sp. CCM 9185]|uniref:DUF2613 domain-containing protein n=1 Tax=Corynebacterium marambiense TaxID=2765364 RepID=A0ABS0VWT8_9CORY|nr:DUF2613 domain-containing protein [Corynebacterium marambiense]MBI9001246.1 DUF2613 domain-containing protein [Corynebacterium marambiense]MCK7663802.1 DUF2613 domain-containing protein [Corynebacterium marambiense]MCX7542950.1 DUF2613 domain-containing protein [Corynebacterium marambiense]
MAFESDSDTRRTIGPALASVVVGVILGGAAVIGVAKLSGQDQIPQDQVISSDEALLGGAEYGTRE